MDWCIKTALRFRNLLPGHPLWHHRHSSLPTQRTRSDTIVTDVFPQGVPTVVPPSQMSSLHTACPQWYHRHSSLPTQRARSGTTVTDIFPQAVTSSSQVPSHPAVASPYQAPRGLSTHHRDAVAHTADLPLSLTVFKRETFSDISSHQPPISFQCPQRHASWQATFLPANFSASAPTLPAMLLRGRWGGGGDDCGGEVSTSPSTAYCDLPVTHPSDQLNGR